MNRGTGAEWVFTLSPPKSVFYDIRAISDHVIDFFMTADGKLSSWRCDERHWTHLREYNQRVDGPFLVSSDGQFIVTEVNGQWSLVGPLDEPGSRVVNIAPRDAAEPLVLVEDATHAVNYFWFRDKLLDDTGRELHTISPTAITFEDRFRDVVAFAVSRRPNP